MKARRKRVPQSIAVAALLFVQPLQASPIFLDEWRVKYPLSESGDINCQLCHRNPDGNSPWNAYGWALKTEYNVNGRDIQAAFSHVEALNSDQDEKNLTNLQEITTNAQPGWRFGNVNSIYNCDGFACQPYINIEFPPVIVDPYVTRIESASISFELKEISTDFGLLRDAIAGPISSSANELFVYEISGIVWRLNTKTGDKEQYLNLSDRLIFDNQDTTRVRERGLLGFAFHPNFFENGLAYLHTSQPTSETADFSTLEDGQTADHQTVITELTISNHESQQGAAQISAERVILKVDQPQQNNNGGGLVFDDSGFLYIGLGDGGGQDDQGPGHGVTGNGQNVLNPLAAILRIDPLGGNFYNGRYGIPAENPFIDDPSKLNEIYAYGFRNPGALSFDANQTLYVNDAGQGHIEEINRVDIGGNYGWNLREGIFYFNPNEEFNGLILTSRPEDYPPFPRKLKPFFRYDHDEGSQVVGGHVYEGRKMLSLRGKYIFADAATNRLFIGSTEDQSIQAVNLSPDFRISAIVRDKRKELYLLGQSSTDNSGVILKLGLRNDDSGLCFPIAPKQRPISIICL